MLYWCIEMPKLIFLVLLLFIISCDQKSEESPMNTITIKIGESGNDFLSRNKLADKASVDKQPAGLNFYEYHWKSTSLGTVRLDHGEYSFDIPFVLGLTGTEDTEFMQDGIDKFLVQAGVSAAEKMLHDEARQEIIKLINKLVSLGWKRFIYYQEPRLKEKDAFYFNQKDDIYGLPVDYTPSLDEWMSIRVGRWYLYAGDIFLQIEVRRDKKLMAANQEGAYLLAFNFMSSARHGKAEFTGDDRERWKDLWIEHIKTQKKERYKKEADLSRLGMEIYSDYAEPKIHPADPVEP